MVKIINPDNNEEWNYHLSQNLIPYLDAVKKNNEKRDEDYVVLIDGYEGTGKSTLAQQIGRYLDNSLNLDKVCMTADEFKQRIINAKRFDCIIYDEAVMGLSSSDSITRIGRLLKSMMMQMRQKNLYVIIIIPTFFELNKYAVLSRAKGLFRTYKNKGRKGFFVAYNQEDMKKMYLKGKRTHTYCIRSYFTGRFVGKYVVDDALYRKKKEDALFAVDDEENQEDNLRDEWIYNAYKNGMTQPQIIDIISDGKPMMTQGRVSQIIKKIGKIREKYEKSLLISN